MHVRDEVWVSALHNLYLVMLGIAAAGTMMAFPSTSARLAVSAAAVSLGIVDLVVRRTALLTGRSGMAVGYFVTIGAAASIVTAVFPPFSLILFGLLPLAFVRLAPAGAVTVGVVAVGANYLVGPPLRDWLRGVGWEHRFLLVSRPWTPYFVLEAVLLPVVLGLFTAWAVRALRQQNRRRQALVDQLAATQAELADTARGAGRAEERQRLAHELHDTLAQGLAGVVLQLEAAEQHVESSNRVGDGATRLAGLLARARETAVSCLVETRRAVEALRPESLNEGSLADAVAKLSTRWTATHGVLVRHAVRGRPERLPPQLEVVALRVVQEALANIGKHAGADEVAVAVEYRADELRVFVRDDGCGFDVDDTSSPNGHTSGGSGLAIMRERVASVAGSLSVVSAPGHGTVVTAALPAAGASTTASTTQGARP